MPSNQPILTESIPESVQRLLAGQLVAIPTETVYGLAADATNEDAIRRVFQLKGRPVDHPLIVHCYSVEQASDCAQEMNQVAVRLAEAFWPGPLTLVLPKADWVSPWVTAQQDSVAVRIPAHPMTRELLRQLGRPLVAPSANRFGRVSPTTTAHVADEFPDSDLLILDGGSCEVGIESTIVDCRHDESVRVLRPGKITEDQLWEVLDRTGVPMETDSSTLRISGNLPSHYAPQARVVLVEPGQMMKWLSTEAGIATRMVVVSMGERPEGCPSNWGWYSIGNDPFQYARELYGLLRKADEEGYPKIVLEMPVEEGIGIAIRDRLLRAAYRKDDSS